VRSCGWAIVGIGALALPTSAKADAARRTHPRPKPDASAQRLNDAAFSSGHASTPGAITFRTGGDTARPTLGPAFLDPPVPRLAGPQGQPLPSSDNSGLRLGGQVQARTIGGFLQGRLKAMGVKDGEEVYGGRGRVYLFAAVRGQAVGMNLVAGSGAGLHRDGWSSDTASALVGDGQVGVGWRKGRMEADLGYVHRGVHIKDAPRGVSDSYADDMAAVSLTFRPH
jgi:hypothetical protein